MKLKKLIGVMAVAGFVLPGVAHATYGFFSHGYGMKAKGMAGAATAVTGDTFGGANNPATMVWAGDRMDVGLDWFSPKRKMQRTGAANGLDASATSDKNNFYIPEFGYNRMMNPNMSLGVSVFGNGGMNTDYSAGQITGGGSGVCNAFGVAGTGQNVLCGNTRLGVNLEHLIIAPTLAYKLNTQNSIGVSPLFGYAKFKAEGLQGFAGLSSDATNLTNRGDDSATGWGLRVGYYGQISDNFSVGAAYATKVDLGKFDKYKGLFAEQGDMDIPENYNVGIAFKLAKDWNVALDYQRINYSQTKSVGNPSTSAGALGADNGRGFGWSDVDVWKIGVEYNYSNNLVIRAGYGTTDNPIQSRDVTFNILAPAVVKDHYTAGFTYTLDKNSELTMAYMHASKNTVSGTSLFTALGAGNTGNETIEMYENSLGIAYGMKF